MPIIFQAQRLYILRDWIKQNFYSGYNAIRLVQRDSIKNKGERMYLGFVEFDTEMQAFTAMNIVNGTSFILSRSNIITMSPFASCYYKYKI